MTNVPLRVLLVDDEPLARELLRELLAAEPDVEIAGECEDGVQAVRAIRDERPDVVFLDVQMPGLDGFGVVQTVGPEHMPTVVFATAYDQYALRAFDASALDYLLKPFDEDRVRRAVARVRERVAARGTGPAALVEQLSSLLRQLPAARRTLRRVVVQDGEHACFVPVERIDWIEAEGKRVRLHCGEQSHLARESIGVLERQLDPEHFLRVHRSAIVRIDRVQEVHAWFKGDYLLMLPGGARVTTGASYRAGVRALLGRGG